MKNLSLPSISYLRHSIFASIILAAMCMAMNSTAYAGGGPVPLLPVITESVSGTVTDLDGNPLPGALVRATEVDPIPYPLISGERKIPANAVVTSDANGNFLFPKLVFGNTYSFSVEFNSTQFVVTPSSVSVSEDTESINAAATTGLFSIPSGCRIAHKADVFAVVENKAFRMRELGFRALRYLAFVRANGSGRSNLQQLQRGERTLIGAFKQLQNRSAEIPEVFFQCPASVNCGTTDFSEKYQATAADLRNIFVWSNEFARLIRLENRFYTPQSVSLQRRINTLYARASAQLDAAPQRSALCPEL